jgi:hypothetical protein
MSDVTYGISCERTTQRTAALTALVFAIRAHRALSAVECDGSAWDIALTGERAATHAAVDACVRVAARVLPPGLVGGELLAQARNGRVAGLEIAEVAS